MIPASTEKLLTATAALEVLDPQARFKTTAVAAATPNGGVVAGDLTLVGGGDPLLSTADYVSRFRHQPQLFTDLDALAAAITTAGVRQITGSVVGDERRYDPTRYVAGWPQRYIDQNTVGPLSALAVNDGFAKYPTAAARDVSLEPAAEPAVEAAAVLTRLLESRGVDVVGNPRAGAFPAGAVELGAVESAPLIDVLGELLRESDNNTAELLLKELGLTTAAPTTAGGAAVVTDIVADLGPHQVVDGSGLSLDDRVTCQLLVDVLNRPGTGEVIDDLLAVAGQSGTLTERFRGTPLEGVLRAKTGSLTSVASLAGIVDDDDPPLTFAFIVNADPPTAVPDGVGALQQQVGEVLASWPRTPDVAVLGPKAEGG
jgi:D-alanyl-D-alanine carboxypeptidase/D-alanyl-D-alanine-endopeptidase (penicillin-binding protein 4)